MAERKVLNKYFPPTFDPSKIPKRKALKDQQIKIRFMMPMTVQCTHCGEFIPRGKKFNAREEYSDEMYLTIRKVKFFLKCTNCCNEVCIKTSPETQGYDVEFGAQRNFEPSRQQKEEAQALKVEEAEKAKGDQMALLESRAKESKREVDRADALEELRERNARTVSLQDKDHSEMIRNIYKENDTQARLDAEISMEQEVAAAFNKKSQTITQVLPETIISVKQQEQKPSMWVSLGKEGSQTASVVVRKRKTPDANEEGASVVVEKKIKSGLEMLGTYSSSDSD